MSFTPLDTDACKQMDLAIKKWWQHADAKQRAWKVRDPMTWVVCAGEERLHKTDFTTGQMIIDLGARCPALERLHDSRKVQLKDARGVIEAHENELPLLQRLNMAHGAARVPSIVVRILEQLWARELMDFYSVIGTHALYAYEASARVVFDPPALATNDVDLLWNVEKRLMFAQIMKDAGLSMIDILQAVDPSFERSEEQKESAINSKGFAVDFLRRREEDRYADAIPLTQIEGDIYPAQADRSQLFFDSPVFEQVVIAADGRMTLMRTIDPKTFVEFKGWMSGLSTREAIKRHRDKLQALAVQQLLDEGRLKSRLS